MRLSGYLAITLFKVLHNKHERQYSSTVDGRGRKKGAYQILIDQML